MNQFQYVALTAGGQKVSGALEAESEAAVLRVLEEKNLFPLEVQADVAVQQARFTLIEAGKQPQCGLIVWIKQTLTS